MKRTILIVEDNKDIQEIYKIHFEAAGFLVDTASDGLNGLVDLVQKKPDIVLLDLMMPTMDGYEVLRTVKEQSSFCGSIIVCSNLSQKSDIDKAYRAGADHYLLKSNYSGEQVVTEVLKFLDK